MRVRFRDRIADDDPRRRLLGRKAGLPEDRPLAVPELPVQASKIIVRDRGDEQALSSGYAVSLQAIT